MEEGREVATRDQLSAPPSSTAAERWVSRLVVAAAVVYAVGAVLVISRPVPAVVTWGLLAGVTGLVAVACLVGAVRALWPAVGPIKIHWGRRPHERDEWAETWELLLRRPVS